MSYRYPAGFEKPGLNTLVSPSPSGSYTQYGGIWKLNAASAAQGAGTWPTPPAPHLLSWGQNNFGQLGLGNTTYYSSPKQVGSLTTWTSVESAYNNFSFAIKSDGTLWSWGYNGYGQLGLSNTTAYSSPKQVGALTNWLSVTSGSYHALALKTDGTLWSWGRGLYGALGLGNTTDYSSPKQVGSLSTWRFIASYYYVSFAIKTDGTLWAWGANSNGQLGLDNTTNYSSPKQVGSLTNWSSVSTSYWSSVFVKTDGTLWTCGYPGYGTLGLGNIAYYSSPKQVGALTNWLQAETSNSAGAMAVKTDGTLWAWGFGNNGQLGLGNTTSYSSPKQVGSLTNWLKVSCGQYYVSAIKADGTLWAWGQNNSGKLGLGDTTVRSSPTQVGSLATWQYISCGSAATLAIAKT